MLLLIGATATASSAESKGASSTGATAKPAAKVAPANDVGITATEIHVATIADVQTAVRPGLFQKSIDVVKAWAAMLNQKGGLAGRKIVVDAVDSKLNPNDARNAAINACQNDFALVGSAALLLTNMSDVEGCKNAQGQPVGIPNLAGIAFTPIQLCSPATFSMAGNPAYCSTQNQGTQKATVQVGDAKYFLSKFKDLHGIWIYNSDVPTAKTTQVPIYLGQSELGIKRDAEGFYAQSGTAPQSALTPIVGVIKRSNSTFAQDGSTPPNMVLLRKEAELQGATSVKVWNCAAGCYTPDYIQQGGTSVEGTYQILQTIAYFTEYKQNKTMKALVAKLGGIDKIDSNSLFSFAEALLFQDAVEKIVASGKTLDRQALFNQLKNTHSFNADSIFGATDIGNHAPSPCFAMAQVTGGKWKRIYPKKPGSFDCKASNIQEVTIPSSG